MKSEEHWNSGIIDLVLLVADGLGRVGAPCDFPEHDGGG